METLGKELGTVIENEVCKLRILYNPDHRPQHANVYYRVELLSGVWPKEDLITICDNSTFGDRVCHFGGKKSIGEKTAEVTVYVD